MTPHNVNETKVAELLREKYQQLGKKEVWTTLLEMPSEKHLEINTEVLRIIINEMKQKCIYVSLSKPFPELKKLFHSNKIDLNNLFFIDSVSQMYGLKCVPTKNCIYTPGPPDINSITTALRELLSSLPKEKKCVFLDSINTLLLYNPWLQMIEFSQSLTRTLRKMKVDEVIVSTTKGATTEKLIKKLSRLCDETISIGWDDQSV